MLEAKWGKAVIQAGFTALPDVALISARSDYRRSSDDLCNNALAGDLTTALCYLVVY